MSTLTLPQTNGAKAMPTIEAWQRDSVKTFFTAVNWEDQTPTVQEIKQSVNEGSDRPLDLKTSVCQFFAAVNWDGIEIAAAPAVTPMPEPSAGNDDLTLEDFLGLF